MSVLPANGIRRVLALITYGLSLIGMLVGAALAIDARYAKADEIQALRQDLQCATRDIKLTNLSTRESILTQEAAALESARQRRRLSALEIQRYNDVLSEHDRLQVQMKRLENLPGCP